MSESGEDESESGGEAREHASARRTGLQSHGTASVTHEQRKNKRRSRGPPERANCASVLMKLHLRRTACNDPANSHPATQQRPPKCAAPHRERRHSHARAQQQHTLTAMRAFHRRNNGHHVDLPGDGEVHCGSNEELREHDMCFTAVSVSNPPTTAPSRPPSKPFVAPDAPAPAKLPPLPASDRLRPCNPMHAKAPHAPSASVPERRANGSLGTSVALACSTTHVLSAAFASPAAFSTPTPRQ
jgi:hypothetical protein